MKAIKKLQLREKTQKALAYVAIGGVIVVSVLIMAVIVLGLCWLCKTLLNGVLYG